MFDHVNMISCFDALQNFPRMGEFASKRLRQGEMGRKYQTLQVCPISPPPPRQGETIIFDRYK